VEVVEVRIPTPFQPGHVTGYLFAHAPVTIVDPGPARVQTVPAWTRALEENGLRIEQVEQIVLTHQHWDHLGAAQSMRELSGAAVLGPPGVRSYTTGFAEAIGAEVAVYIELMRLHGMPASAIEPSLEVFAALPGFVGQTDLDRVLEDGAELSAGRHTLTALARPGHSPTDTILMDSESRVALVGDHLLADYPPNFLPPVPSSEPLNSGLRMLTDSLERTAELELARALPGHGQPVEDVRATIERWLRFYRRRDERMLEVLAHAPLTAWELARALDPQIRRDDGLFKLVGALGPLERLEAEGRVVRTQAGGSPRFATS
jgi:glyoxylase-like metal-dependent hydrolase (beta-lactamase superfamily II)